MGFIPRGQGEIINPAAKNHRLGREWREEEREEERRFESLRVGGMVVRWFGRGEQRLS